MISLILLSGYWINFLISSTLGILSLEYCLLSGDIVLYVPTYVNTIHPAK